MIYDPFPRAFTSVAKVRAVEGRARRIVGIAPSIDPKAPSVKRVRRGRKMVKRIKFK